MASPRQPAPDNPALHPLDPTQYRALADLVARGLSKDGILLLSKLGTAGVHNVLNLAAELGREGLDGLLSPLEGVPEEALRTWLHLLEGKEREPTSTPNPPRAPIDDPVLGPNSAASLATAYLRPPRTSLGRSTSRASSESLSTSTSLTHPSSRKRVRPNPKSSSTRKLLHCPDCKEKIKNGFDKHFRAHLDDLVSGGALAEGDLIGCGYCPCDKLELDSGKVFHGLSALVRHVHEEHAQVNSQTPHRLRWDFDASFKNILSGEENIRRAFLLLVQEENRDIANKLPQDNTPPTLSWLQSSAQHLLDEVQKLGGKIFRVPFTQIPPDDAFQLKDLVARIYDAAHKWQPSKLAQIQSSPTSRSSPPVQQRPQIYSHPKSPHHRPPTSSQDTLAFASMGAGAEDISQYPSFDSPAPFPQRQKIVQPTPRPLDNPRDRFAPPLRPSSFESFSSTASQISTQTQPSQTLSSGNSHLVTPTIRLATPSANFPLVTTELPILNQGQSIDPTCPATGSYFSNYSAILSELGLEESDLFYPRQNS